MTKRMLIDATHDEETRVAVVDDNNNRLLEFDYENKFRKPLKGSIFLAKVTRVEPSLQAAFVNFGGNRHGFLPFSEIHPDYYRIPVSDREALLAEQEEFLAEEEEREEAEDLKGAGKDDMGGDESALIDDEDDDVDEIEEIDNKGSEIDGDDDEDAANNTKASQKSRGRGRKKKTDEENDSLSDNESPEEDEQNDDANGNVAENRDDEDDNKGNRRDRGGRNNNRRGGRGGRNNNRRGGRRAAHRSRQVEILGGTEYEDDDASNASDRFRYNLRRQYKIQEVIKRGQIMLIQASREERGNKGAAVSTYLSLPGRYGVLMPNSPRAGGVSRKIAKFEDRQRMRSTLKELDVPKGMSVILRTAGVTRTKTEIKRDVDYLMRLWDDIRERTLQSSAPALIYEEADLIKRAVRDLYTRDVEEIQVAGEDGFAATKKFMKMMIPSHVKKVKEYKDDKVPLFHKYRVENQIAEINEITAKLKSGGYLVINPTEALVSIDVNSGRATKERHIEETALNTNMEAAEEVARQLRLRDLGGLVVIDFIDMEDRRNNAKVERKLKESLSGDRARIQIGRISSFGLLELSRQRLNPSLTEAQYEVCKHCEGRGVVRNCDSTSIMLLRALEEEGIKARAAQLIVHVSSEVAIYILNNKRRNLDEIETRYGFSILLRTDDSLGADKYRIEVARPVEDYMPDDKSSEADDRNGGNDGDDEERNNKRKRGRRGGRGRGGKNRNNNREQDDAHNGGNKRAEDGADNESSDQQKEDGDKKSAAKRGGRKTGSSRKKEAAGDAGEVNESSMDDSKSSRTKKQDSSDSQGDDDNKAKAKTEKVADKKKSTKSQSSRSGKKAAGEEDKVSSQETEADKDANVEKPKKKAAASKSKAAAKKDDKTGEDTVEKSVKVPKASNDTNRDRDNTKMDPAEFETVNEPPKTKKKGWWNKLVE
ncbi:MAG: ribonuclease [Micavibrio sp.]|nr:ribonuclease [Micavibrio sp.]